MNVEGKSAMPTVNPTITAGAYTAGKIVGGLLTIGPAFQRPQTGIIYSLTLADKAKQDSAIDVVFFKSKPAGTYTDAATFAPSAADLLLISGVVKITSSQYSDFSANSVATVTAVGLVTQNTADNVPGVNQPPDFNQYAVMVSRGTPTYASTSDLQLTVGMIQD